MDYVVRDPGMVRLLLLHFFQDVRRLLALRKASVGGRDRSKQRQTAKNSSFRIIVVGGIERTHLISVKLRSLRRGGLVGGVVIGANRLDVITLARGRASCHRTGLGHRGFSACVVHVVRAPELMVGRHGHAPKSHGTLW